MSYLFILFPLLRYVSIFDFKTFDLFFNIFASIIHLKYLVILLYHMFLIYVIIIIHLRIMCSVYEKRKTFLQY